MPTPISNSSISSQFRTLVLSRMSQSGIIPAELARRLGCTDQNVALLLSPGRDYKLSTMERIAAALGFKFSISDLESESGTGKENLIAVEATKRVGRAG